MTQFKTDKEILEWFLYNSQLNISPVTPYKHKITYYNKQAHYINGKKVNRHIYKDIKKRQETLFKNINNYQYLGKEK